MKDEIFKPILLEAEISHGELQRLLRNELSARADEYVYIVDVFATHIVYSLDVEGAMRYFRRNFTVSSTGKVEFGEPVEVSVQTEIVPIGESAAGTDNRETFLSGGNLIESADDGAGWLWRVQVIQAGVSKNRTEYPLEVLHKRAPLYEGVTVYYGGQDHDPGHRGFTDVGGWMTNPHANDRGVEATFEINRGKPELRETFLHAWDVARRTGRTPFGFSHVIPSGKFKTTVRRLAEGLVRRIDDFTAVESVDIVMRPSAGGELIGLVAAVDDNQERTLRMLETLLEKARKGEALSEAEKQKVITEAPAEYAKALEEALAGKSAVQESAPVTENVTDSLQEAEKRMLHRIKLAECRSMLTESLAESKLPEPVKEAIRDDFKDRVFEADELKARIVRDTDIAGKLINFTPRVGQVAITEDERDKKQKALDGMMEGRAIDGVTPYMSLKSAFKDITGSTEEYISPRLALQIVRESQGYTPEHWGLRESVSTASWTEMLGDSITRRMIAEYNHPDFQTWKLLCTDIVPVQDFRTQRRMRVGGYGNLPSVGEGATYQPLASPPDEEATYAPAKYGGLEDLTLETIVNDDVGAVRRIPVALGRAARRTIYDAVWNGIIAGNATCTYDSTPLFDVTHGNTATTALSAASLLTVENAMRDQKPYAEAAHVLGASNMPKILAVPNELRDVAFRLTQSQVMSQASSYDATEPNIHYGRYQVVVIDDWTNDKDWYAFADPRQTPFLEAGFLNGREEPELYVQDQANVGSNFTADKVTYKIRHIWGFGILDHRGAYRMDV